MRGAGAGFQGEAEREWLTLLFNETCLPLGNILTGTKTPMCREEWREERLGPEKNRRFLHEDPVTIANIKFKVITHISEGQNSTHAVLWWVPRLKDLQGRHLCRFAKSSKDIYHEKRWIGAQMDV